jgi:hypothetical protein
MRLPTFCLAAILTFCSSAFAQHATVSSGGGGGGASISSGSHTSFSGGGGGFSGSSSGGHSSATTGSHGSSTSHGSAGSSRGLAKSAPFSSQSLAAKTQEKRGFFSFLRHPFKKPQPKLEPVADLHHRICFQGPCLSCPQGEIYAGGGCVRAYVSTPVAHTNNVCRTLHNCLMQSQFDDCEWARRALQMQAQRLEEERAARDANCTAGPLSQECSDAALSFRNEDSLMQAYQRAYLRCTGMAHAFRSRLDGLRQPFDLP